MVNVETSPDVNNLGCITRPGSDSYPVELEIRKIPSTPRLMTCCCNKIRNKMIHLSSPIFMRSYAFMYLIDLLFI